MALNLNSLRPPRGSRKDRKRVARGEGSGRGATSGRGNKGQQSRSGGGKGLGFEGGQTPIYRRLPKLGGFANIHKPRRQAIDLDALKGFKAGETVDLAALQAKGLVRKNIEQVRILSDGEIKAPLTIIASHFSAKAKEKITAAGGTATLK